MPTVQMRTPRYRGDATSRGAGSAALQGAQLRLHWGFRQGARGITRKLENRPMPGTFHADILKTWSVGWSPGREISKGDSKGRPSSLGVVSFCEGSRGRPQGKRLN